MYPQLSASPPLSRIQTVIPPFQLMSPTQHDRQQIPHCPRTDDSSMHTYQSNKDRIIISGYNENDKESLFKLINDNISNTNNINNNSLTCLGYSNNTTEFHIIKHTDYGGRSSISPAWIHYFPNIRGIILIIDSTNTSNLGYEQNVNSGKFELESNQYFSMIPRDVTRQLAVLTIESNYSPLLIFAIKQDLPNSLNNDQIMTALEIKDNNSKREIHIESLNLGTGAGLIQGMQFLSKHLHLQTQYNTVHSTQQAQSDINTTTMSINIPNSTPNSQIVNTPVSSSTINQYTQLLNMCVKK